MRHVRPTCPGLPWGVPGPKKTGEAHNGFGDIDWQIYGSSSPLMQLGADLDPPAIVADGSQQSSPAIHDGQEFRSVGRPCIFSHAKE